MLKFQRKNCLEKVAAMLFYLFHEHLGRLEGWNLVLWNDDCRVLGNVAGCLLRTGLNDEAAKSAQVNVFAVCKRVLN